MTRARKIGAAATSIAVIAAAGAGCTGPFGRIGSTSRLVVTLEQNQNVGSPDQTLPLTYDASPPITVDVRLERADGSVDTSFNGYVRISVKPGAVVGLSGANVDGRNVLLQNGVASGIGVSVAGSYGQTHIWAEDAGYTPVDPRRNPPPQCSNGIDDNGNGLIDYPADPGCAFANDDTEDPGSFAAGASSPIWFTVPRVADVRGVAQGGVGTSFPHQQVAVDTGFRPTAGDPGHHDWSVIVTRIASDGFYVTDVDDPRGFTSVFAYNFSTPPLMRICDRLRQFGGTASDFYGFTEIGFPTWQLEPWDPRQRPCLIPEPQPLVYWKPNLYPNVDGNVNLLARDDTGAYVSTQPLTAQIAALVRVRADTDPGHPEHWADVHVTSKFGPGFPSKDSGYTPQPDATNCDLNGDAKVDFSSDTEGACAKRCQADVECTEFSNYLSHSAFNLVVIIPDPQTNTPIAGSILADGSTWAEFDPLALRGKPIHSFTGTLRYFSGGAQYTVEARCQDDIVIDMDKPPLDSDRACVQARTISDNSSASN